MTPLLQHAVSHALDLPVQDFRALYTQQQQAAAAVPAAAVPAAALKQKSRRQQTGPNTAAVTGGS